MNKDTKKIQRTKTKRTENSPLENNKVYKKKNMVFHVLIIEADVNVCFTIISL